MKSNSIEHVLEVKRDDHIKRLQTIEHGSDAHIETDQ